MVPFRGYSTKYSIETRTEDSPPSMADLEISDCSSDYSSDSDDSDYGDTHEDYLGGEGYLFEPLAKAASGGDSFTLEDQEDASLRLRKIVIGKSCIHSMK